MTTVAQPPETSTTPPGTSRISSYLLTDYLERHPESLIRGKPDDKKN